MKQTLPGRKSLFVGIVFIVFFLSVTLPLAGCKKKGKDQAAPPAPVSVIKIEPKDTPLSIEFVGQTQSSHQVEIRARVNGFLDKRVYKEGNPVKAGDVMFKMDPKPFQAQLDAAMGALSQQQARLANAQANLARVKPLTDLNALSQKDLDDATGQQLAAAAAVETAKAEVEQARLNLSYTTIASPVSGLSSYARVQEGSYVNVQNSLLTYVSRIDPIWINFSLSENDILKSRRQEKQGIIRLPADQAFSVEVVLADGITFPGRGKIFFADAEYNQQTGTFLVRSTLPNPGNILRPGQFVRVRILGIVRPNAIIVPQRAVQQGGRGHFVWVVDKQNKANYRPVVVGDWNGNDWFINEGLQAGDQVVVDGGLALRPDQPVQAKVVAPESTTAPAAPPKAKTETKGGAKGRN